MRIVESWQLGPRVWVGKLKSSHGKQTVTEVGLPNYLTSLCRL